MTMTGVSLFFDKLMKLTHLDTIFKTHNVKKENILFLDDNPETIDEAIQNDFKNSIIINSIDDVLEKLKLFIIEKQIPARNSQNGSAKHKIRTSLRKNKNIRKIRRSLRKNKNMRKSKLSNNSSRQ